MLKPGMVNLGDYVISEQNNYGYAIIHTIEKTRVIGSFKYRSTYKSNHVFMKSDISKAYWELEYNNPIYYVASELDKVLYL